MQTREIDVIPVLSALRRAALAECVNEFDLRVDELHRLHKEVGRGIEAIAQGSLQEAERHLEAAESECDDLGEELDALEEDVEMLVAALTTLSDPMEADEKTRDAFMRDAICEWLALHTNPHPVLVLDDGRIITFTISTPPDPMTPAEIEADTRADAAVRAPWEEPRDANPA